MSGNYADNLKQPDMLLLIPPPLDTKMPHLGVAYLSRFLRERGINVLTYDLNIELYNKVAEELKQYWRIDCLNSMFATEVADRIYNSLQQEINKFVDSILEKGVRIIGFSVNQISIFLANKMARQIKARAPSKIIIFGGPGTFFKHPRELIEPGFVDIFVLGEGEQVLFEIISGFKAGRVRVQKIMSAVAIKHLDSIPFPDFGEFQLAEYNPGWSYKPLPLLFSRGCFNRCSYCVDYIMWPRHRVRSPKAVIREIEYHLRVNKAQAFELNDLLCNGNLNQLSQICDLVIKSGLKFNWVSYASIRADMSGELLAKLKKSGCHSLIYGLEHASNKVLRTMNKRYTAEAAQEIIRSTHQSGICANINFIVGFPGETENDFNQIREFLYKNKDYINEVTNVSACTLFPEASLGRWRKRYGVIWQEGQDPMLFKDTYGLNRQRRNERVVSLLKTIDDLGLKKGIVNRPQLNPALRKDEK